MAAEQALDGLYIVRSNVEPEVFDADQMVRAYKGLSKVERFRCMKWVDLRVRAIYHRRPDGVGAHVLLRMLAYYVEWDMRRSLAPLLLDDHDREGAERKRVSEVAPARRTEGAASKASSKRTEAGLPVHSLWTAINDLGTLSVNTMLVAEGGTTLTLYRQPTPVQQRFAMVDAWDHAPACSHAGDPEESINYRVHRPSSIVHRPSSIVHRPSSIVHRPSSIGASEHCASGTSG